MKIGKAPEITVDFDAIHIKDKNGKYAIIDTDRGLFENKSIAEMGEIAKKTIKERFRGKVLYLGNDGKAYINKHSGEEYTYPANPGIIDIGISDKKAMFYGMSNIKRVTSDFGRYSNLLLGYNSELSSRGNSYDTAVPQNEQSVNTNISENTQNDIDNNKKYAVTNENDGGKSEFYRDRRIFGGKGRDVSALSNGHGDFADLGEIRHGVGQSAAQRELDGADKLGGCGSHVLGGGQSQGVPVKVASHGAFFFSRKVEGCFHFRVGVVGDGDLVAVCRPACFGVSCILVLFGVPVISAAHAVGELHSAPADIHADDGGSGRAVIISSPFVPPWGTDTYSCSTVYTKKSPKQKTCKNVSEKI